MTKFSDLGQTCSYKVKASPYFKLSVQRLSAFLSRKYSAKHAMNNKKALQEKISKILPGQPYIAPVSSRLVELGISDFRQWVVDEHNIIFYRVADKETEIILLLVMDGRQDIHKLLQELVLLR